LGLTAKQLKFIASYQIEPDATKAAINAGYVAKSAHVEGNRLLKNPKIKAELDAWRLQKAKDLSKDDFITKSMECFNELDVKEPNKPRFLDLAGKALGYIGANQEQKNQTLNLTQININGSETPEQLWELTRKLLGNDWRWRSINIYTLSHHQCY